MSDQFKGNYKNQLYLYKKHKKFFKKFPKAHSKQLQVIGTHCMFAKKTKLARKFFKKANKVYKKPKNYILYLLSFLGSTAYKKILKIKVYFKQHFIL